MILAVRSHEGNPWVLERIASLREHYRQLPQTVVVDLGSAEPYRAQLAAICEAQGLRYLFEADEGTFSLARGRNLGVRASQTPLLFFNDVDCFGGADLFERLLEHANRIEMGSYLEQVINLPVYSLSEGDTQRVWSENISQRGEALAGFMARAPYGAFSSSDYRYVDASSNFFLIRRDFFELVGGYNENFRGHGSEDFEFFVRLANYTDQFPLPDALERDLYGPTNPSYFEHKGYRGFRRYMELVSFQAECAGLRIAHLYHPRGVGRWYEEKDHLKQRFSAQVDAFRKAPSQLLDRDWLPREKSALVLLKHEHHYQYFLPLRLMGYRLQLMLVGDADAERRAIDLIERRAVDRVAVFNPYMGSQKELSPWLERVRGRKIPLLVVDRGMVPESWFFAEDMPYGDSEYQRLDIAQVQLPLDELEVAREYAGKLRRGGATLEQNGDFAATLKRRQASAGGHLTVLIPLQLDDDVAVTYFNAEYERYPKFVADIAQVAKAHPTIRFLVKTHPLSKQPFACQASNVVACDSEDNIHALIELSDAVVCYNSGVGFLALIHEKPLVTVGNAFYNIEGTGTRATDLNQALEMVEKARRAPAAELITRYLAWHLFHKYAFFKATSELKELRNRRAHNYRALLPYQLPGGALTSLRASVDHSFQLNSYAAGKLVISSTTTADNVRLRNEGASILRKLRKLARDPRRFARDSKLGRKVFG